FNNILGMVPFFPGGANLTGNINLTLVLSVITFLITNVKANGHYWKHIFWMPGVPVPMKIFLAPLELMGIFTKPIALMIRLFANITAGHILVLALLCLIFVFKSIFIAPVSVVFVVFISMIELLVGFIQAFIFTVLTALFIGLAVQEHGEH
ncbi:MAG: F0F1 ATP synthase subunit A, partial [Pedobacter sp.]|nr:F0F1 ATP synthase subunit A [Pedobacter sp.]